MAPTLSQYFCFSFSSLAPKHHIVLLFSLLSTENARHKSGIEKKWLAFCSNRLFFSSASDMHTKMEFWKHQFYFLVSWLRQLNPEKYNCPAILYTAGIRTWYLSILVCHRAILYMPLEKSDNHQMSLYKEKPCWKYYSFRKMTIIGYAYIIYGEVLSLLSDWKHSREDTISASFPQLVRRMLL